MENFVCPSCKGKKQIYRRCFPVYLCGWETCGTCAGSGEITAEKQSSLEIGRLIKAKRIELRILLRDAAAEFGYGIEQWANIERGECTVIESENARDAINSLSEEFVDKYDVFRFTGEKGKEKVITLDTPEDAELALKDSRDLAAQNRIIAVFEIVPRKERIIKKN